MNKEKGFFDLLNTWINFILCRARICEPNFKEPAKFNCWLMWYDMFLSCLFCYVCKLGNLFSKRKKSFTVLFPCVSPTRATCISLKTICICTLLSLWALSNFCDPCKICFYFPIKQTYTSNFCYRSAPSHSANRHSGITDWWQSLSLSL